MWLSKVLVKYNYILQAFSQRLFDISLWDLGFKDQTNYDQYIYYEHASELRNSMISGFIPTDAMSVNHWLLQQDKPKRT